METCSDDFCDAPALFAAKIRDSAPGSLTVGEVMRDIAGQRGLYACTAHLLELMNHAGGSRLVGLYSWSEIPPDGPAPDVCCVCGSHDTDNSISTDGDGEAGFCDKHWTAIMERMMEDWADDALRDKYQ